MRNSETLAVMVPPNTPKVKRLLFKGTSGADVKFVQECLDTIHQYTPYRPFEDELENTGTFGRKTLNFVKSFQIYCGLETHGWVDKITMDAITKRMDRIQAETYKNYQNELFDRY